MIKDTKLGEVRSVIVMPEGISGKGDSKKYDVPIWFKSTLTLEETAAYSGIGINKLREITNQKDCKFVLFIGTKRLIKRRLFEEYIEKTSVL